jgi:putative SOS response-associated peptidase YedK
MPVILPRKEWGKWPGEEPTRKDDLQLRLNPFRAERMSAYPISTRVNRVKNDDAGL